MIIGGLGFLGLEVVKWMVKEGVKYIVLIGCWSLNEIVWKIIGELEVVGVMVNVLLGDIFI